MRNWDKNTEKSGESERLMRIWDKNTVRIVENDRVMRNRF